MSQKCRTVCDRCGLEQFASNDRTDPLAQNYPNWREVTLTPYGSAGIGFTNKLDLCPGCFVLFKKWFSVRR